MKLTVITLAATLALLGFMQTAGAASPPLVPVQGVLADANGTPLDTPVDIRFAIYDIDIGGQELWSETQTVLVENGLFTAYLGQSTALDLSIFRAYDDLWLGMQVGVDPEGPRIYLGSTPFSAYAEHSSYSAGSGISISSGNVVSATLGASIDGDEIADGTIQRADLSPDGCASGEILKWNGTGWVCASDDGVSYSAGSGISISGGNVISATLGTSVNSGEIADGTIQRADLSADGCASGEIWKWNGTGWVCASDDGVAYSAGSGISISGGNVISATLGTSVNSGEIANGTIQRADLSADGCASGEIWKWNGTGWVCASDAGVAYSAGSGISISGGNVISATLGTSVDGSEIANGSVLFNDIGNNGCSTNQIMKWNGSAWACSDPADSFPSGFCIFSRTQSGCPSGWTRQATFDGATIRGAGSPGGTGGAATHTHSTQNHTLTAAEMPAHSHNINNSPWQNGSGEGGHQQGDSTGAVTGFSTRSAGSGQAHNHGNTSSANSWPPYVNVVICCKN